MTKVFLSAGYGGFNPGAATFCMKEKDMNLDIMLSCKDELIRHGVEVICSRISDENDPVKQEVREANLSKATIAVSFRTNPGKGNDSESYYWSTDYDGMYLAELCEEQIELIGQNSRGVKAGNGLYFINGTHMTSVLCECAFIDDKDDTTAIDTKNKRKEFGIAYAKAILKYLEISYNPFHLKSIDEIAKEVISGKWGSGEERKNALTNSGYNYKEVQKRVNELS